MSNALSIQDMREKVSRFDHDGFLIMSLEQGVEAMREAVRLYDAAKIEPGGCWYCTGIESHSIATVKTVTDEYGHELGAYDTPYNYCPNCGRQLDLIPSESTQSGAIRQARGDAE